MPELTTVLEIAGPANGAGDVRGMSILTPTFLERWGVTFVSVSGGWMLGVGIFMLVYHFRHMHPAPTTDARYDQTLHELHKTATDRYRTLVSVVFW
jgi:hypothetical protein